MYGVVLIAPNGQLNHYDEDAEIYLNGIPVAKIGGYSSDYEMVPLSAGGACCAQVWSEFAGDFTAIRRPAGSTSMPDWSILCRG
jgi:hypothetical protein